MNRQQTKISNRCKKSDVPTFLEAHLMMAEGPKIFLLCLASVEKMDPLKLSTM